MRITEGTVYDLGGGLQFVAKANAADDYLALQIDGEPYPRLKILPNDGGAGGIRVGNGLTPPTTSLTAAGGFALLEEAVGVVGAVTSLDVRGGGATATSLGGGAAALTIPGALRGTLASRPVASAATLNMIYVASDVGTTYFSDGASWFTVSAGGGGHTIQDEGANLTTRTNLNFVGPAVAVTDDAGNNASKVTISALVPASNLSDVASAPTARTNLGVVQSFIGTGGNDTAAVQALLNTYSHVRLLGTITVTGSIAYNSFNVIEGDGTGATTIQADGAVVTAGVFVPAVPGTTERVEFRNLRVLNTNASRNGIGLDTSDAALVRVDGCRFSGWATGIKQDENAGRNFTFYHHYSNCTFSNCTVSVDVGATGTLINQHTYTALRIQLPAGVAGSVGIQVGNARDLAFINCDVESTGTASANGKALVFATTSREVTWVGGWLENTVAGVTVPAGASNLSFVGTTITGNTVDIADSTDPSVVRFLGCNISGTVREQMFNGMALGQQDGSGFVPTFLTGSGSPLTTTDPRDGLTGYKADRGSLYLNHAGGAAVSLWIKETGNGNRTGWVPVNDASSLSAGTVAPARLGSGTANSTTYLRGDGTWATPPTGASQAFAIAMAAAL